MPYEWQVAALAVASVAIALAGVWLVLRFRMTPEKREQRRRLAVNRQGRLVDGTIVEASQTALFFTYSVGGVAYHASQDISRLGAYLPADPSKVVGPAWLKYSQRNPANSIVVCERWSGLRSLKENAMEHKETA